LSDPDRADFIKSFVADQELLKRWNKNFPNPKDCQPTLTRMTPFVRNPSLRKIFECPDPEINIAHLMDNRKILLVDLGGISESTKILGTLLIAKIRQASFRRAAVPQSRRIPFFLYVDEFEFFQTSDFDQILSFAGGYGLRLTLANQFIGQLDTKIRQSIFGNVGSFIVFCISLDDAKFFRHLTPEDVNLAHLPPHYAMYHIGGRASVVKKTPPPPPTPTQAHLDIAASIRKSTLDIYSCKSAPLSHTSGDGTKPDPEPTLPHDAGKGPGTPAPQPVLRPHNKPARHATKKPDSH
jgi:hypothetical protein